MRIEFRASPGASVGIEMELTLVDRDTRAPVGLASAVLDALGEPHPGGAHPRAKHELFECTVEIITDVCHTVAEARADLARTLGEVRDAAGAHGATVISSGTHPFGRWQDQIVSPDDRYHRLVDAMQWPARRLAIAGIHVHVGVRSGEKAITIANALQAHLPLLLALSASSPYWEGHDTGLASARVKVFEMLPTAGLPPVIADWRDFEQFMHTLVRAEAISTIREVWWDIRPHPGFGTVEVRVCDAVPTLREVAALAALTQCLVQRFDAQIDAGEPPVPAREWTVRQNKWFAARHGIDGDLIVDDEGRRLPAREVVAALVEQLAPEADALGCRGELADVAALLDVGPSYRRQRAVVGRGGSLLDVVDALERELRNDRPEAA